MNLKQELNARRSELRRLVERVPVFGPAMISAFRKVREVRREVRRALEPKKVEPVPHRFIALYKERTQLDDLENIADPVKKMHAEFALSTVTRGRRVIERIGAIAEIKGKRCLDVGCAYGGFLVAFSGAGARRVVGIDINSRLLDYARALLADHGVDAEVKELDVLDENRSLELGRFDVITCNDVIEHVLDPAKALDNLGALLDADGTLYMEIPNRWAAGHVLSDGHYRVFGLTVLPKKKADAYFARLFGKKHDVTYKSLPFYINRLAKLGFATRVIRSPPADPNARFDQLAQTFRACVRLAGEHQDREPELARQVDRIARAFDRSRARYDQLRTSDPRRAERLADHMLLLFGDEFWTLFIERRPERARTVRWSGELG